MNPVELLSVVSEGSLRPEIMAVASAVMNKSEDSAPSKQGCHWVEP